MRKLLIFIAGVFLVWALPIHGQTVSQIPGSLPFTIDPGSSFTASPGRSNGSNEVTQRGQIVSDVSEAQELIRRYHVSASTTDNSELTKSSINGMLAELDPHSSYFDSAEFSSLLGEHEGEYSGTGSTISNFVKNGSLETYVMATHTGSAAESAHLRFGDRIVAVDGVSISGLAADVVRDRVRGPRGTKVRITVERSATGKIESFDMRRERVSQPSIPNYFVFRGAGYIGLSEGFNNATSAELAVVLKELHRRRMNALILDLRGNTGGILEQAVKVAEMFLPAGSSIISQRGRYAFDDREWRSSNRRPETLPVVVLVDKRTASASEVVAAALQDNDRAMIVGQNTFGKGLVQNVVELPTGSGMTLTTARYFAPSGRSLQRSYSSVGTYDYFTHRAAGDGTGRTESRTVSDRKVLGGNGITPDEITEPEQYDTRRAALLDPIFFFVRDVFNGKVPGVGGVVAANDQVRHSIIFNTPMSRNLLPAFRAYAASNGWSNKNVSLDGDEKFIADQLGYYLALAAFGTEAGARQRIESDDQIEKALQMVPASARLAENALRLQDGHKKARRVAFPSGQGRNRRN